MKKTTEKNDIQGTETVTLEDMTKEQLIDLVGQLLDEIDENNADNNDDCNCCDCCDDDAGDIVDPIIGFSLSNVINSKFDEEEFSKGIKSMSFVAGQLITLQNAGITPQNALEYLHASHAQDSDCECTMKIAEMQFTMGKEAEKKALIESKKNIA